MSEFTVIGVTKEVARGEVVNLEPLKTFSGKNAGICYMKDKYFDSYVSDDEKANKRFYTVVGTGHHSISDHTRITVLLEGIPKFTAMLLNSLQDYSTSEKSGRYTEMTGSSNIEVELYNKWRDRLQGIIKAKYPTMDDKYISKLAMENARYFLSVFSRSTTMSYTASLRQWNYIYDWCESYLNSHLDEPVYYFQSKLDECIRELRDMIKGNLYVEELRDFKHRHFRFLALQTCDRGAFYKDSYNEQYCVSYEASFAYLAQAQRHRTLKYFLLFDGLATKFYVPPILSGEDITEWVNDMQKVSFYIPQGTLVRVKECGDIDDFLTSKCQERLCGRAQLEIAKITSDLVSKFVENKVLSSSHMNNERPKTKCELLGGCKEPCFFGVRNALTREV